jgi:hypothetical protein
MKKIRSRQPTYFCKRGGSSGGGGGAAATASLSESSGTHTDYDELVGGKDLFFSDGETEQYQKSFYEAVSKKTGLSIGEAKKAVDAIHQFTASEYAGLRSLDKSKGRKDPEIDAIYKFLDKAPKYKGELYRGINFTTKQELESYLKFIGDSKGIQLKAMSSFSSSKSIAEEFASGATGTGVGSGRYGVILHVNSNKSGASIRKFSNLPEEDEVLVPKGAKYRVTSASQRTADGKRYVDLYLDEVK